MSWDQKSSWISYPIEEPTRFFDSGQEPMFEDGNDLE